MKHRDSGPRSEQLSQEIAALTKLSARNLKERWRSLYATEPPPRISRQLLTRAVAYRLQEGVLGGLKPSTRRLLERVAQGFYVTIDVNRALAAQYGLTVGDVQRAISSGMGAENIATTVEGRERYPINVRYLLDYRDNQDALRRVLVMTSSGAQTVSARMRRPANSLSEGHHRDRGSDGTHAQRSRRWPGRSRSALLFPMIADVLLSRIAQSACGQRLNETGAGV